MIHAFDYSRYKVAIENATHRNHIELIYVNPAYTTFTGVSLYQEDMKLNSHQAASYVIARKGQGYINRVKRVPKGKKIKTRKRRGAKAASS
jgi:hypothetical protein